MCNPLKRLLKLPDTLNKSIYSKIQLYHQLKILMIHTDFFFQIERRLRKINGIFVFGTPVTSVIAIGSTDFHIYRLSEALSVRGWNLNTLQFPCGIHICVTHVHTEPGVADQFLEDVNTELEVVMQNRSCPVEGKVKITK